MACMLVIVDQDAGKGPVRLLSLKFMDRTLVIVDQVVGKGPVRLLALKYMCVTEVIVDQDAGKVPVRPLFHKYMPAKLVIVDQDAGKVPVRLLLVPPFQPKLRSLLFKPMYVTEVIVDQDAGKVPVRLLQHNSTQVTTPPLHSHASESPFHSFHPSCTSQRMRVDASGSCTASEVSGAAATSAAESAVVTPLLTPRETPLVAPWAITRRASTEWRSRGGGCSCSHTHDGTISAPIMSMSMRRTVMKYGVVVRGPLLHLEVPSGVGAVKGITESIADPCPPRVPGCKAEESLEQPGGSVHSLIP
mmetsp:Transcript_39430/g.125847  ORF Transcript_39430/g.125847 Transcript_39430/m.125847 type:complete len:303 (-) Transcript_39430:221-1129(-)